MASSVTETLSKLGPVCCLRSEEHTLFRSGTDPTPVAATTFSKTVNWVAIGTV